MINHYQKNFRNYQKYIYLSLENLIKNFNLENWDSLYINWELNLIKELGFDADLDKFKKQNFGDKEILNLEIDGVKYQVPKFIISDNKNEKVNSNSIKKGLIFSRSLMLNKFFLPNNLNFPKSRILLENYF